MAEVLCVRSCGSTTVLLSALSGTKTRSVVAGNDHVDGYGDAPSPSHAPFLSAEVTPPH